LEKKDEPGGLRKWGRTTGQGVLFGGGGGKKTHKKRGEVPFKKGKGSVWETRIGKLNKEEKI